MTLMERTSINLKIYQFENLKMRSDLRINVAAHTSLKLRAAGRTSLKLRAAGMEALLEPSLHCTWAGGPKKAGDCRQPDRGTRAAQKDLQLRTYHLLPRTFYSIQLDKQTTTKYYSHV
jgi:hypothetical protein